MAIYRKWITILVILLGIQFASSQHIALLSHTPIVHDSQTSTLTCADLSENSTKVSLFIRREFTWSGSRTSESTYTRQVLKRRGMLNTWTGERVRKAIGAFGCGRGKDAVSAVKMHANGSLIPHAFTKLVISGSKVVIKMKLTSANTGSSQVGLRKVTWYKDGHILDTRSISRIWEAEGGRALVISSVKESDAGIYMAHHTDEDKINAAGTILIVRSCPLDKWGSSCDRKCPICLHGGVCNEGTGLCICSAGFSGRLCDQACEPSFFGGNCQHNCASLESEETSCQGFQLCSVVGCACMSGWMGLECEKACPPGLYGADCSQSCRCYHGGVCNRYKGCICTDQWTGPSCQVAKRDVINSDEVIPVEDSGNNDRLPSTTVEKKPNITAVLADPSFKVNQGQNVEVQCAVTGIPSPQHGEIILKRKNQIEIAPTETKMTETVTTSFFELTMGSYPGPFWCVATTSAGFAQKQFNFTIPVLPTPSNPPELVIKGATFLKLKLNSHPFIGDGPIKKTILLMKQSGQGRSFNTYERNIVNDTAEVRDLLPYTDYTFRVLLYREGGFSGRGHPGPTAVIKTDCGYPSSGPSIKNIHSKNNSILYLSWRLPPPSEIKGEVLGYKIYYRALGETSPSWTKVIFAYSSTTSATLKNMKPLAVYSVKIRLYNCAGDSPDSKEVRVTMGRLKKPDGPNVNLVNQTSRCLGFTWKPPTNAKPYTISGYEVLFEETTNPSADRLNILQNVSGMVFTRNSLTPYTTYKFRVRAYNHEGPGNFSDEMNVTTNEEAPGQPSNFHVESRTPFQIELSWDVPLQPNGIITQYIINSSRDGEIWKQKTTPGDERSVSILGLAEYTKYLFQIQAVTIEPGAWSVVLEARTMSLGPLEPPQSIDVNSPSPQSVSLSWLPPPASIYVHKVKQYKIIYTDDLRQRMEHWKERLVDGIKRSEEIMNLRSDTVYLFAMAAVTQRPGPFSERKTIRTRRLGVPPPPKNVYLTNVTSNSAIIHWKVENGYSITNVRIRIKSGNTLEWQDLLYLASSERAMLEQLDSGTRYSIELTAGNHNGESSGNPIKNFQTLEASVIGEGIILQVLVPVLVAVVAILFGIIVYCKCRGRSDSDSMSTAPLEMDSISNHMRVSTIGSSFLSGATINSRSGTLLSSHSVHSGNSRAPSTHSGQLLLAESLIICWENILFEDIALGEGNFGQVVKAVVQREDKLIQVAVKMLKDGCSVDDRKDFLAELDMMARLGNHKNIISLVGACENDSSLYLCTEYAPNGNLLQFLRKSRHSGIDGTYTTLTQNQLLQFALDVCEGMAYLSDKQLIHRDLAARNVLLSGNLTCKVADFGLSRGEGVYVKKTVARLPIRWMAIESLNYNVYTTKSDVWSFGVLLWEIVSLGGTPYYGMSCAELYEKLPQGYRMEQPLNCDSEVYKLMSQCWKNRPYDRPSFSQLCVALRRMIDARSSRNYVNTSVFENFMFATIDANEEEG